MWRKFAENPADGFQLPVWEENFTRQQLREMLVKCYKSFYLRPRYIARNLLRIRRVGELKRKLRAGLSVVTMSRQPETLRPGRHGQPGTKHRPGGARTKSAVRDCQGIT